ncbi:maltokinase N-terminal cap-like domain-containing protein [Janibacter terrae]|uniref:maltokinase N-terminal cap-like domain-containing protein n=1 Tax=Janibacter terrae TaxID=103817 RepID=UPI0008373371|nr:aminoglycoside phosphotransferase family protein [Janibacter terrae]MBA4085209.1 aminoglycoside phosphotransferase [Kytococcus sp.]
MATIHDAVLRPDKVELVTAWMGGQRWYVGAGRRPRLTRLDSWRLDDPAGEVGIETIAFLDESGTTPVVYQVPLTYRGAPLEGAEAALVGEMEHSVLGHRWVYDAPHDPVYVAQLLRLVRGQVAAQAGSVSDTVDPDVVGAPHPAWQDDPVVATSRVLVGEQSNTSIIVTPEPGTGAPVIIKVFRTLSPGENPDITLQGALAASHSPFVPASVGHVAGAWQRPDGSGRDLGQVVFAQEYLEGATDAWRVALRQAAEGEDFSPRARELGRVLARVHEDLARALPCVPADRDVVEQHVGSMRRRSARAMSEVPALAAHQAAVEHVLDRALEADWPALQRIHGDLHLGQVLDVPDRGWVLIDFEGEPLRPLAERNDVDSPLRDVAGVLRSIDYVVGTVARTHPGVDAGPWGRAAQTAFLDGYAEVGTDPRTHGALLTAHVLDKALYEVVYEAHHRPGWLALPTAAVEALVREVPS